MASTWNPDQYLKFAGPRLQPAIDLLARVQISDPRHIYDLGCGTGNVTRMLRQRWPQAEITGVDNSTVMLAQAARDSPGISWVPSDLARWQPPAPADLIFSNAALHWLPRHDDLFPRLVSYLTPGGTLAIQMPSNFLAPSHTLIADTVMAGSWRTKLAPLLRPVPVAEPAFYFELLESLVQEVTVWETEYLQALEGPDPVKEWVKGTWLKPLLDALDASDSATFETDYARRLRLAYRPLASGVTLFPFRRLFLIARR